MSGRASASVDINVPAANVAASATAILNDINLSTFASSAPSGLSISGKRSQKPGLPGHFQPSIFTEEFSPKKF
jgi:hypothetical protein